MTTLPTAGRNYDTSANGGSDLYLAKLDPAAGTSGLNYATYLGGALSDTSSDTGGGVAVDGSSNAYLTGTTASTNFPVVSAYQSTLKGAGDAIVAKLDTVAGGSPSLVYSTYLGSTSGPDTGQAIAVDNDKATVVGLARTFPNDFPQHRPFQLNGGGGSDGYVTQLDTAGSGLSYSSFLGGSGTDQVGAVALDAANNPYLAGQTTSTNLSTTPGGTRPPSREPPPTRSSPGSSRSSTAA